ncbi:substrate-binding periplasmic protein [Agarivorans sp. QJM3NY_29]|uniref:substrate-binding periplasmic protein n=1 Tax=unclassified Agarivorans TaxID=2636026 RepID=UPI003D7D0A5E
MNILKRLRLSAITYNRGHLNIMVKFTLMAWLLFGSLHANSNPATLRLYTNISPPYQEIQNNQLAGSSVEILACLMETLDWPYAVQTAPWKRVYSRVRAGEADGFFSSLPFPQANDFAALSSPAALEKWYWFYTSPELVKDKVGIVRGATVDLWLQAAYPTIKVQRVNTLDQLVKLLIKGRVNSILMDKQTFENVQKQTLGKEINSQFEKYSPLGFYFSKAYLANHPDFLDAFNQALPRCVSSLPTLSNTERVLMERIATEKISEWVNNPQVIRAVEQSNQRTSSLTDANLADLNSGLQKIPTRLQAKVDSIINSELSDYLEEIAANSAGLYLEIIVFDARGVNVGQSQPTSDYWQGDEAKYSQTYLQGNGAMFIDDINYDASTRNFLVQVSLTISSAANDNPIGGVTIGIDIEKALMTYYSPNE